MADLSLILAAGFDPLGHVLDKPMLGPFTMNTLTLFLAFGVFWGLMTLAANAIAVGPESEGNERYITKGHLGRIIEVLVLTLRDKVVRPQLGSDTNRFMPFLMTIFFLILTCNLIGLVPLIDIQYLIFGYGNKVIGGTPTGRLGVTAALATVAFFVWNAHGIRSNGVKGWLAHFTAGAPVFIWPIIIVVEVMGAFVKPAALMIRLFANMTAGHVLLGALIGFTGFFLTMLTGAFGMGGGLAAGIPISIVAIVVAVAIFFLELFVAFLQAFIFMFLTTIFIAQMSHHHHDDHAGAEDYGHEGHSAATDEAAPVTA
ncbi:MAG: F0F1 ATP synthase subunit A [Phycisphaerales bacterium]